MIKQAPSLGRLAVMVGFALSCVGILLFLWLSFGGSVPLKPESYRIHVRFPEATQLAQEADVRISGVNVGRVKKKTPDRKGGLTDAEIELDDRFAPIPRDTRAILRQKTLLGETYVELTPGDRTGPDLADGGRLPQAQVSPAVELDEIFRTFDPTTRRAFSRWLDQQGRAVRGRGEDLNDALGALTPFAEESDDVLRVLRRQSGSTRSLVRDTGAVFGALTERRGQLRDLIANSNRVFETTARRDRELAESFRILPTFLDESRATVRRVTRFAQTTDPLITQLRPAARELSPTLVDLSATAPHLRGLFRDLGPLIRVSRRGLPALERVFDDTRPLLARLDPTLRNLVPIFNYLGAYRREITAFFSLVSAATQATERPPGARRPLHYLRSTGPTNPESLAIAPERLSTNRSNPYREPGGYEKLRGGLEVFGTYLCGRRNPPQLDPEFQGSFADLIREITLGGSANAGAAPACRQQQPLGRLAGQPGLYPRLQELAPE